MLRLGVKQCSLCHEQKPVEEFNLNLTRKDGRQNRCRACTKSYYRANATRHKAKVYTRNKRVRQENRARIWAYLEQHPCVDCGETDPVVLEFDHVRGVKKFSLANGGSGGGAWGPIAAEIAKCEVRCANCHRRKTARQFNYYVGLVGQQAPF